MSRAFVPCPSPPVRLPRSSTVPLAANRAQADDVAAEAQSERDAIAALLAQIEPARAAFAPSSRSIVIYYTLSLSLLRAAAE
jgi:hypothetical protein